MLDEKEVEEQGRPWNREKVFSSFEDADSYRKEVNSSKTKEAKVKRQSKRQGILLVEQFIVMTRELEEKKKSAKASKKKNKSSTKRKRD